MALGLKGSPPRESASPVQVGGSLEPPIVAGEQDRRASFENFRRVTNVDGIRAGSLQALVLIPPFVFLDLFLIPERFFWVIQSLRVTCIASVVVVRRVIARRRAWANKHSDIIWASLMWLISGFCDACAWAHRGYESPYCLALMFIFTSTATSVCWRPLTCVIFNVVVYLTYLTPLMLGLITIDNLEVAVGYQLFLIGLMVQTVMMHRRRYAAESREFYSNQDLQQTKATLEGALARLQELDQLKSNFFANVSHELRTPLTLSLGPIESLLSEYLGSSQRTTLDMVRRNLRRLHGLINNLLDYAKLEAGKETLRVQYVPMKTLVNNLVSSLAVAANTRGIRVTASMPEASVDVWADREKLERVLTNLLSNAYKFTREGGAITATVEQSEHDVVVSVRDTGIGIPQEKLGTIFDRFAQADSSSTRKYAGTGIGLAMVKEYVELHGGSVLVESVEGSGSLFTVRLPRGREHYRSTVAVVDTDEDLTGQASEASWVSEFLPEDEQMESEPPLPSLAPSAGPTESDLRDITKDQIREIEAKLAEDPRLLVVDDTADMRIYLRTLLQNDYAVWTARDGIEGLEKARRLLPDLILSDVMMPRMDGEELCRTIKQESGQLARTPIVLMTARAEQKAKLVGLEQGADDYLFKPFNPIELQLRVRNLLRERRKDKALFAVHRKLDLAQRVMDKDLAQAQAFQQALLPQPLVSDHFDVHAVYRPLYAVGGDIYDIFTRSNGSLRVWLADMVGHGVRASLRTAVVRSEYEKLKHDIASPGELFTVLSEILRCGHGREASFSGICLDVHMNDVGAEVRYAASGDYSLWKVSGAGEIAELAGRGSYVGLFPATEFPTLTCSLRRGSRLFCFTDGIEEQTDGDQESFDQRRLSEALGRSAAAPDATDAVEGLVEAMDAFRQGVPCKDDITVIALGLKPS